MLAGVISELKSNLTLVGARITAIYATDKTLPYVVVTQTGGVPDAHSTAESGLQESQFAIRYYAEDTVAASKGAVEVRLALSAKTGVKMGGNSVQRVIVDDIRDAYAGPGTEGDSTGRPGKEVVVTIWHQIAVA